MFFTLLGMIALCMIGGYFILAGIAVWFVSRLYGTVYDSCLDYLIPFTPIVMGLTIIICTFVYSPTSLIILGK